MLVSQRLLATQMVAGNSSCGGTHSLPSCNGTVFPYVHAVYTQGNDLEGKNGFGEREDNLLALHQENRESIHDAGVNDW